MQSGIDHQHDTYSPFRDNLYLRVIGKQFPQFRDEDIQAPGSKIVILLLPEAAQDNIPLYHLTLMLGKQLQNLTFPDGEIRAVAGLLL